MVKFFSRIFFGSLHSFFNRIKYSALLESNTQLKNKYSGQRCFIIGNGVSLNTQDLSHIKNEITIVSNSFFHHPCLNSWQPTFYCIVDPVHFVDGNFTNSFFSDLTSSIKSTNFFFPIECKDMIDSIISLKSYKKNYVYFHNVLAQTRLKNVDLTKSIPKVQSVSQFEIMLAIYLGCSSVYLIGMDHDWLASPGNINRFYNDDSVDKFAFSKGMPMYGYKDNLEPTLNLWKGYEKISDFAAMKDIRIFNATNGGFLDVFPRVDYEKLFH
jgi:hypothetical protein